jgi:hypothetical protein
VGQEKPEAVERDVEQALPIQEKRERVEEEHGKKGPATTAPSGRSSEVPPAPGAVADASKEVPAEQKTDVLARTSEQEIAAGEGAPEAEMEIRSFDEADVDAVAANKAAPMPAPVTVVDDSLTIAADDTVTVAGIDEQRMLAAVDSVGGKIVRSFYDQDRRLVALEIEMRWDQYEAFMSQMDAEVRPQSSVQKLTLASERAGRMQRQPRPDIDAVIIRVEIRR